MTRSWSGSLSLLLTLLCSGCTPSPGEPTPSPQAELELLRYHVDRFSDAGGLYAQETVYETTRFVLDTPMDLHGLRVFFEAPDAASWATLSVWGDFGHNYFNYDVDTPLWEKLILVRVCLTL